MAQNGYYRWLGLQWWPLRNWESWSVLSCSGLICHVSLVVFKCETMLNEQWFKLIQTRIGDMYLLKSVYIAWFTDNNKNILIRAQSKISFNVRAEMTTFVNIITSDKRQRPNMNGKAAPFHWHARRTCHVPNLSFI